MKKFSFLLLGLFSLIVNTEAQTQPQPTQKKLSWGFKLGINGTNLRRENRGDTDWKTGLVTGVYANIKTSNRFSFQPEFLYSSMGGKNFGMGDATSMRLNYFSLPILGKYRLSNKFSVFAGPQIDVMIVAKAKDASGFEELTNDFKENSFNATSGAEFWPTKCLGFSGRYIYGFNNILNTDAVNWKNQGLQLALALKL